MEKLRKRPEFLFVQKGARASRTLVLVQARRRAAEGAPRVGFTATKKLGNAVVRNRAKRRLREAAARLIPAHGVAGCDYVLIAREGVGAAPWPALLDDVQAALIRLRAALTVARAAAPSARPGGAKDDV